MEVRYKTYLRRLRENKYLTLRDLAKLLNKQGNQKFSSGALSNWENGNSTPAVEAVVELSNFFNVEPDRIVVNKIQRLREEQKMSVNSLADKSGVDHSDISRYERRISIPTMETCDKLAEVFGVSTDCLMGYRKDGDRQKAYDTYKNIFDKSIPDEPDEIEIDEIEIENESKNVPEVVDSEVNNMDKNDTNKFEGMKIEKDGSISAYKSAEKQFLSVNGTAIKTKSGDTFYSYEPVSGLLKQIKKVDGFLEIKSLKSYEASKEYGLNDFKFALIDTGSIENMQEIQLNMAIE